MTTAGPETRGGVAVADAVVAGGIAILGVLTIVGATAITIPLSSNVIGPRAFPYAVGASLVVAGIAVLVGALRGHTAEPEGGEDIDTASGSDWLTLTKVVAAFAAHVALLDLLGWALAAAVLFGGVAWALGATWWRGLLAGLVLGLLAQVAFVNGLGVTLPAGIFSGVGWLGG